MTVENRILVSPSDIVAIQYKCTKCGASATIPIGKHQGVPDGCTSCGGRWFQTLSDPRQNNIHYLLNALRDVQQEVSKFHSTGVNLDVMLELNGHGLNVQK